MRIRRLGLERFGHFSDLPLDFGDAGESDFHLIYGPNEAGKTTAMTGFLRLLYGFKLQEPYDFRHGRKNLRVSATLDLDGQPRDFVRLPTRKNPLQDGAGKPLPEAALGAYLSGLSTEDYRKLLCLDDETIEVGGEEIAASKGDIGRLLFSAAAGVADLSAVLDGTREQADALYRKRASSTRLAELKHALKEVESRIRELDLPSAQWHKLKREGEDARAAERAAREARDGLREAQAVVAARRRCLPDLVRLDQLRDEIAPFAAYPERLDTDPEALHALSTVQATARAEAARLDAEIATTDAALAVIDPDPARLALAQSLDELDTLLSRVRTGALDLPRRRDALADLQVDMRASAAEFGAAAGSVLLDGARPAAEIDALETARNALHESARARTNGAREAEEQAERVARLAEAQREALAGQRDHTPIAALLDAHDADALAPAVAAARQAIDAARDARAEALARLARGGGPIDTLPHCPLSAADAAALAEEDQRLREQQRELEQARATQREEALAAEADARALREAAGLRSDADADAARAERDRRWAAHRAALDDGTADEFAAAMAQVDELAAHRLGHAQSLGELRQIERRQVEAQTRAAAKQAQLDELSAERASLNNRVAAHARAAGLGERSPAALREWVDQHAEAAALDARHAHRLDSHRATLDRADALLAALGEHLPLVAPDFESALNRARQLAADARQQQAQQARAAADLAAAESELNRRRTALAALDKAAKDADAQWRALVQQSLGDAVRPEQLGAGLGPLRELRELHLKAEQLGRQIQGMSRDEQQFAGAITQLAAPVGIDAADPLAAHGELRRLAAEAARDAERQRELGEALAQLRGKREDARRRLAAVDARVRSGAAPFPDADTIDSLDLLRQRVERARVVIEQRAAARDLQAQILNALGAADLAAAREQLAGTTAASLEAQAGALDSDLAAAESQLSEATAARGRAEAALAAVSDGDDIARLVEQRSTLELEIEAVALDYLELSFGLQLADSALRQYRDQHRSGMMSATERAFAELTNGKYTRLSSEVNGAAEVLRVLDADGTAKAVADLSKGSRFQLYLALRAAAYEQLIAQGTRLPFFCDDIFETFDDARTRAACRLMEHIGRQGQAIYLTHHRHVVEIAREVCALPPRVHEIG